MGGRTGKMPELSNQLSAADIRDTFLDFFAQRGHTVVASSSLIPADDPTLLFTNAGMVQFKDVFLGTGERPYKRAVDSQKCMRVAGKHNDLDDVGRDDTHHTFFEMLGNWSFGDYYKEEAIAWAWELLTEVWRLPKERFYATCFEDELGEIPRDDEAAEIWARQPGFDPEHILFFGRDENFWEMADRGPCGPDSEIHFDQGPDHCNMQDIAGHVCQVNGDCSRFLELWNLVFIQYNRSGRTKLEPLPSKHVDTGMGFERIVSLLQGVRSNYETDLFQPLFDHIQALGKHTEAERNALLTPYRVIADHVRAASFLIADGVTPGNTGRNYICRMIIRRASRFGSYAGFEEPFLAELAQTVVKTYGNAYPELARSQKTIEQFLTQEEQRFARTVDAGVEHLNARLNMLEQAGKNTLPGSDAFDLYATYGLPLEITRDLALEQGMQVDEQGFRQAMETHRLASSSDGGFGRDGDGAGPVYREILDNLRKSGSLEHGVEYDPYQALKAESPVLAILRDGVAVDSVALGDRVELVLERTGFYVEAGGQVTDTGVIVSHHDPHWEIKVEQAYIPVTGIVTHRGVVVAGNPKVGDPCLAIVDVDRRWDIMRNHTATHLLHAALRKTLGEHARQAGSLVAPDRLRFDFSHPQAVTPEEQRQIQRMVNEAILQDRALLIRHQPRDEAMQAGAMALFGESYGDTVRTVSILDGSFESYELCGGTHVASTGVIGPFIIVGEGSVAAGVRRIEALTGRGALEWVETRLDQLDRAASALETTPEQLEGQVLKLEQDHTQLARTLRELEVGAAAKAYEALEPESIAGIPLLRGRIDGASAEALLSLADRFREEHESGVLLLSSSHGGKPLFVAAVTEDLVARGLHAADLVRDVARHVGGGGGGKPTLAQAGGKTLEGLNQALEGVPAWIEARLQEA